MPHNIPGLDVLVSNNASGTPRWNLHRIARSSGFQIALIVVVFFAQYGCRTGNQPKLQNTSPLTPIQKAPEQTELEVVFVHTPQPDKEAAELLWKEIDEQAIPARLRRNLNQNGFRVGVLGTQLSPETEKILRTAEDAQNTILPWEVDDSGDSIRAIRRKLFLKEGQRGELLASGVQEHFHVLHINQGEISGHTFSDGQGQFLIEAARTDDGRVQLKLSPEVHYGEFRNQYIPGEGMFQLDTSRRKERFDQMCVEANLSGEQTMIIGAQPNRPGSLGHRFFNEQSIDKSISKLLFIRVCDIAKEPISSDDLSTSAER